MPESPLEVPTGYQDTGTLKTAISGFFLGSISGFAEPIF
jgi:hypothetical protein